MTSRTGLFQSGGTTRIRAVRVCPSKGGYEHHNGLVSLELSSLCVLDGAGKVIRETRVASEPEALVAFLRGLGLTIIRVGLEAGPLSQ